MIGFPLGTLDRVVKVSVQLDLTPTYVRDHVFVPTEIVPTVTVIVPILSYHAREDMSDVQPLIPKLFVVIAQRGAVKYLFVVRIILVEVTFVYVNVFAVVSAVQTEPEQPPIKKQVDGRVEANVT